MGSTKVVVDGASRSVVASMDYLPFGGVMRESGSWDKRYRYTGQEYDEELSLYNYRARFYDEDLFRFYSVDPAGQGFSPFAYAGNNPMSFTDPTGMLFGVDDFIIASVIYSFLYGAATSKQNGTTWYQGGLNAALPTIISSAVDFGLTKGLEAFCYWGTVPDTKKLAELANDPNVVMRGPEIADIYKVRPDGTLAGAPISSNETTVIRLDAEGREISRQNIADIVVNASAPSGFSPGLGSISTLPITSTAVRPVLQMPSLGITPLMGGAATFLTVFFWDPQPLGIGSDKGLLTPYSVPMGKTLPGFPDAVKVKPRNQRARWKDSDGSIYEWDYQHGRVEKYNKKGKHLGEFDPNTGEQTKPANPDYKTEP